MTGKKPQAAALDWQVLLRSPLTLVTFARKKYDTFQNIKKEINAVAERVDPSIKSVRGYKKRLLPVLKRCHSHCKDIVGQIPGPIVLDSAHYSSSPLIKAAFSDHKEVAALLERVDEEQLASHDQDQTRVALLTMTHSEKEFFGTSREGQMLVADARLTSVTFSDHKVVGIATSLGESHQRLEKVIFDVIIESAANELRERRADLGTLLEQRDKLRVMSKMFGEPSEPESRVTEGERETKIDKVKGYLEETESSLSAAREDAETAGDRLDFLVDFLSKPEAVMDIQISSLRLDWSNVLTSDPDVAANTITFAQCSIHEAQKRDAVLIQYDLDKSTGT